MSNSLNPMDYTAHGILQAGILEWVSFPFSRESSQPRDWTQVSHIAGRYSTSWATGKLKNTGVDSLSLLQGNLPSPGIKLVYRALQADSLPTELSGKSMNAGSSLKRVQKLLLLHDPEPIPKISPQKKDLVLLRAGNSKTLAANEVYLKFLPGCIFQAPTLRLPRKFSGHKMRQTRK